MTNKSTKRRNAVIAAVAGAALLVGGSTYALWQATADLKGGTITSGQLAIKGDDMQAWDISQDRVDTRSVHVSEDTEQSLQGADGQPMKGHLIKYLDDPDLSWMMVPGDTVALIFPYTITLQGDNLVAGLTIDGEFSKLVTGIDPIIDEETGATKDSVTLSYQLFDHVGVPMTGEVAVAPNSSSIFVKYFQDNGINQEDGETEPNTNIVSVGDDGTIQVTFILYVHFDYDATGLMKETLVDLAGQADSMTATLQQVRCTGETTSYFNELNCPVVDPVDPDEGE